MVVYFGPTGSGKTHRAVECAPDAWLKRPPAYKGDNWFDGYAGEADVLFDEFSGAWFTADTLKVLWDRLPYSAPGKGLFGGIPWLAKTVRVTSNTPPWDWYPNISSASWEAIVRRVDEWWFCPSQDQAIKFDGGNDLGSERYDRFRAAVNGV